MRISGQGVLLSLAASVLFVTLPGYVHLLEPLDSLQVVAHRVVWSIPMVFSCWSSPPASGRPCALPGAGCSPNPGCWPASR